MARNHVLQERIRLMDKDQWGEGGKADGNKFFPHIFFYWCLIIIHDGGVHCYIFAHAPDITV